jgi:putative colanic acid biosynthesis UDP-glucose lipid carrier transferase
MPTGYSSLGLTGLLIAALRSLAAPVVCIGVLLVWIRIFGVDHDDAYTGLAVTSGLLYYIFMRSFAERGWQSFTSRWQIATHVWLVWIAVVCILLLFGYATKLSAIYSRRTLFAWFVSTPPILAVVLIALQLWYRRAIVTSGNARSVVIAGVNELSRRLADTLRRKPEFGLSLRAFFDDRSTGRLGLAGVDLEAPLLGTLADLPAYVRSNGIDAVFIAVPRRLAQRTEGLITDLRDTTASLYYVPDVFLFDLIQARADEIGGIPIITLCETPFQGWRGVVKRGSDIVVASLLLVLAAPAMALIALAIKLTSSSGGVIFRQRRYGLDGREITVYKFRTMTVTEDGPTVAQATRDDARVTPLGRFLRRYSLDELPQLINVLQGRMSVVGPRPHAVAHNEQYRKLIRGYMVRHKVMPGITGLAQINGCRGETSKIEDMERRVKYDLEYLQRWSLGLDMRILLRTLATMLRDTKAY